MGILDKIMGVSKKKEKGIPDLNFGSDTGKGPETGIGDMGDSTPGLAGTGDLGNMAPHELPPTPAAPADDTIHGYGHEDVKMEPAELKPEHSPFSKPTMHEPNAAAPIIHEANTGAKDLEVISSKLDALKAQMEMITSRLSTIEMKMDEGKRRGGW